MPDKPEKTLAEILSEWFSNGVPTTLLLFLSFALIYHFIIMFCRLVGELIANLFSKKN